MNKNIGLLLGSFDPPHIGHLYAANYGLNMGFDEVWVVPAWTNPWKTNQTPFDKRLKMCELFFNNDSETIKAMNLDGYYKSNYTHEGLEKLLETTKHFNRNYYIIGGTDIATQIPNWKKGEWILENFGVIEVPRIGMTNDKTEVGIECSSTAVRNMIKNGICPAPFINDNLIEYIKTNKLYI